MVEYSVTSVYFLRMPLLFSCTCVWNFLIPIQKITFARMLSLVSLNLLGALALRMMYRYAYKCGNQETAKGKFLSLLLHLFSGVDAGNKKEVQKIKVAIIGAAGSV